jgi:hypothetical protein
MKCVPEPSDKERRDWTDVLIISRAGRERTTSCEKLFADLYDDNVYRRSVRQVFNHFTKYDYESSFDIIVWDGKYSEKTKAVIHRQLGAPGCVVIDWTGESLEVR